MNPKQLLVSVGAGITTFLVVAVLVIELLPFEFSALVGLPVGLIVGLAVTVGLAVFLDDLDVAVRRAVTVYGSFGLAILAMLAARYVNLGPSRDLLSVPAMVVVGLATGAAVYVVLWLQGREG